MKQNYFKIITVAIVSGVSFFVVVAFLLSNFFAGDIVMKQNFHIGPLSLQYYGLIIAIAGTAGYFLAQSRRKLIGISTNQADTIILVLVVLGFVGARLYHVVSELPYYFSEPAQIFAVWNGGLSIYGALLGGFVAILVSRNFLLKSSEKFSVWQLLDWLVPSLVLGQIIGRFGNFVNYEIYGTPTSLPWKMFVPESNSFFHPLFLYESAASVIILVLLLKLKVKPGALFLTWLFLYNIVRFLLEQIRVGSVMYGGVRVNAIVSLALCAIAVLVYFKYVKPNSQSN
jgi:phosphatidylglycerol:prolipoprotein diacylglycerol transferase